MKTRLFRNRLTLLLVMLFFLWGGAGHSVAGPSATGLATADMVEPLNIQMTEELAFGQVRPGDSAGTVVVTHQNVRTATGGATLAAVNNQNNIFHHRAEFDISGPPESFFNITMTSTSAVHDQGTNPALQVTDLKSFSTTQNIETATGKTDGSGNDMVYVGGTLQVPAGAKNGKYEGDVTITINF
jgi:uncharacterized protein DUF4402